MTIPASGYIKLLAEEHHVECVVLDGGDEAGTERLLLDTEGAVKKVYVLKRSRRNALWRLFNELILREPGFLSWKYEGHPGSVGLEVDSFDIVLATPESAADFVVSYATDRQRWIAAISDCYTAVLSLSIRGESPVRAAIKKVRAWWMAGLERRLLQNFDTVIVQTGKDVEWVGRIGGDSLRKRAVSVPNGVSDEFFSLPRRSATPGPVVVFVSGLGDAHYQANLDWFVTAVFANVRKRVPSARLCIFGAGLPDESQLRARCLSVPGVEFAGYVENILDAYEEARVAVAPIFKSYGFINKVAEAFSAGVPVVGDPSAFNGMEESVGIGCAFVAEDASAFEEAIVRLLSDEGLWSERSRAAGDFARQKLNWRSRKKLLLEAVAP